MPDLVVYKKLALTGGGATALDGVDGADLVGNELAFITVSNILYHYLLNATSGAAESSPDIIAPDVNPGNKRWILQGVEGADISDNDSSQTLSTTAFAKSQDAVLHRESEQEVSLTAAAIETMKVTHSTHIDMTTNSFDFGGKFRLASWTAATMLLSKITGGAGYSLEVLVTTGYLKVTLNALTFTTATAPGFVAGTRHKIKVKVSVGATQTTVSILIDGVLFEAMTPQNNTTSLANASALYILGTSTAVHAGGVTEIEVDNFTETAAEILDAYRNGIPESWKWGSQTSIVTGNDSTFAGASNWTNQNFDSYDETTGGKLTVTASSGGKYCNLGAAYAPIVAGKKYRLQITTSSLTGQWNIGTSTNAIEPQISVITTAGTFSAEFIGISSGLYIQCDIAGTASFDDVLLYQIGATLLLGPESWQQDKPYDLSSNNLTVSYPTTGWTLTKPPARKIKQPTPTAKTTAATLTIAELLTGLLTGTHNAGSTQAYTLPTGTLCDAWPAFGIDDYFDWVLINLSAAAADTITVTAGADHTLVGEGIVQSAHASTGQLYGNSAKFRTRKTAANTFVTYRIG